MTQEHKHEEVRSRNEPFVQRTATRICYEEPSGDNPYIAVKTLCHGYDLFELMAKRSFVDVFYLLFRGELPDKAEAELLQALMIALINPGPRHPATRAAMNAGVGKTDPLHILPIASAVLGGGHMGGGEIESAMRFLRKQQNSDPLEFARQRIQYENSKPHVSSRSSSQQPLLKPESSNDILVTETDHLTPGFGKQHGGIDLLAAGIAEQLLQLEGAGRALKWGARMTSALEPHGTGWLTTGIAAAVFADLGFQPRAGGCLYQLLGAPGLVAHGLELANKPITAMPFVSDENYVIER